MPGLPPFRVIVARLAAMESTKAQVLQAVLLLVLLMGVGAFGYSYLEGWDWMDGLYMTFITLTTIGFAEVRPLSEPGRILTIVLATIGIIAIGFIVTRTTQLLVSRQELRVRQMKRTIAALSGHYVLCGFGRIGARIAYNLATDEMPFVVVERDPDRIRTLLDLDYLYVDGNAVEETTLLEAGIDRARGLIAALSDDADNVFVTLTARELNADLFILSRAYSSKNVRKMERAGANKVVSPYEMGADRMAQFVLRPRVYQFLENALQVGGIDLSLDEVVIPLGSPVAGKTLRESGIRERTEAIVVATVRGDGEEIDFNPGADSVLLPGMTLIVLGPRSRLRELHDLERAIL